jgi:hypothetical protein
MYRVYCNGCEFGVGYPTLAIARVVKQRYQTHFPKLRYYIRRV